jgi:Ca-activated chloride channel family protein
MHFATAESLYLLWMIPLLGGFFAWALYRRRRRLEKLIARQLLPQLCGEFSWIKAISRALLLLSFFTFAILALSRPQWGSRMEAMRRHGVDIIAALDTSYSMNAEDITPSRLAKAKSEVRALIGKLKGDRIGLVTFAGNAIIQCPLTLDFGAATLFLDMANTEIIPEPGTSLAQAIQTASSAFIARETKYKVLVIFTDGEDLEGQVEASIQKAKNSGVIIYTVGIGTPEGKPIPIRDSKGDITDYRKDPDGQVVISALGERTLAQIATATGGRFFRASTSESEIDEIYDEISKLEKKELESRFLQNLEDQFQFPLALAILFLAAEMWISEKRKTGPGILRRIWFENRAAKKGENKSESHR